MAEMVIIEDNELEKFHNAICNMQMIFNAVLAPEGTIDVTKFYELSKNKKVYIIVDNNLMQYIIKIFQKIVDMTIIRKESQYSCIGLK